jgi:hypothetical protein
MRPFNRTWLAMGKSRLEFEARPVEPHPDAVRVISRAVQAWGQLGYLIGYCITGSYC